MTQKQTLWVREIYYSLQGEASEVGKPFWFVRLTGCPYRCHYCDSAYAFSGGKKLWFEEIFSHFLTDLKAPVLLTGGEPLAQKNTPAFVTFLFQKKKKIFIETSGELPIDAVVSKAHIVLDFKTPTSGIQAKGVWHNLVLLKPTDEIKFVIGSKSDYTFAKNHVLSGKLPACSILFSPVWTSTTTKDASRENVFLGPFPVWLAQQILIDRLPVRFQLQLHKVLWGADVREQEKLSSIHVHANSFMETR